MTRFVQYPFDKTKMAEVTEWAKESGMAEKLRGIDGIKDIEFSFCPGEGWFAARYIFKDLDDMVKFLSNEPMLEEAKKNIMAAPHYDTSREPHEFKGFFKAEL